MTSDAPRSGWYYGWNVLAACVLSQIAANGLTYNTFSLFLRDWSAETHTPISLLQFSITLMVVGAAVFSPIVGGLASRYSARLLLMLGLSGIAVLYLAISFTTAGWQILALYAFVASPALTLSASVVVNTIISRWFVRSRGLALGIASLGVGLGGMFLPPLIAAVLPSLGWREVWRIGALFVAAIAVPAMFFVIRHKPTEREGLHYTADHDASPAQNDNEGSQMTWREIMARKNFWLIVAAYLPLMGLYAAYGQNLAPHAASHGLSPQTAGTLIAVFSASHLISTFAIGPVADRLGNRLPFVGLAVVTAAGAFTLAFGTDGLLITIGCALVGLAGGFNTMQASAIAAEFGVRNFGRAYGLTFIFLPLGSIMPVVIAKIQEVTGSYVPGLLGLAAIVLTGGFLALLLDEKPRVAVAVGH